MRDVIITLVYEAENLFLAKLSVSLVSSHSVFLHATLEPTLRCLIVALSGQSQVMQGEKPGLSRNPILRKCGVAPRVTAPSFTSCIFP